MAIDPSGLNATILSQRDLHTMAAINHLKTTIRGIHGVNGSEDSQVLDISDVSIRIGINMGIKTACILWSVRIAKKKIYSPFQDLPLPASL